MQLMAYTADHQAKLDVTEAIPEGSTLTWIETPEYLNSNLAWQQTRILILVASDWPMPDIDSLMDHFAPRHVILVDLTPEAHWHGIQQSQTIREHLHWCELEGLTDAINRLIQMESVNAESRLALLSPRNDCDGALLSIAAAWQLQHRNKQDVLLLDLGRPYSDVPEYLGSSCELDFLALLEKRDYLNPEWLAEQALDIAPGIHVIGMPSSDHYGAVTMEALVEVMEMLEDRYCNIVINLTGMPPSPLLFFMLSRCNQHWLLADQKNVSLKSSCELAEALYQQGIRPGSVNLVLSPFSTEVMPDREMIEKQLPFPVRGELPCSRTIITDINANTLLPPSGEFKLYVKAVEKLLWLSTEKSRWQFSFGW
ncbi:AAA family ATPase [Photobacterium sp. 53610]|uniref:AAA family ATPase n=1 Tax=Photobacterium sp. 53610 TaxID=3102789 RepID=UPI002ED8774E